MNHLKDMIRPYRYRIALILLVGVALYANFHLMAKMIGLYPEIRRGDAVTACEERMQKIRNDLPRSGEVGYVTTVDNRKIFGREETFEDVEALGHYVLTQYTLAPLLVRNSPDFPLVIGNFVDGKPDPALIGEKHLIPVRDYGDGLILYRHEGRK